MKSKKSFKVIIYMHLEATNKNVRRAKLGPPPSPVGKESLTKKEFGPKHLDQKVSNIFVKQNFLNQNTFKSKRFLWVQSQLFDPNTRKNLA